MKQDAFYNLEHRCVMYTCCDIAAGCMNASAHASRSLFQFQHWCYSRNMNLIVVSYIYTIHMNIEKTYMWFFNAH